MTNLPSPSRRIPLKLAIGGPVLASGQTGSPFPTLPILVRARGVEVLFSANVNPAMRR